MAGLVLLLIGVLVVLVAVLLILVLLVGIVLMLRRRSKASDDDPAERTEIREERPGAKTVPAQPAPSAAAMKAASVQKSPAPAPSATRTPAPASPSGPHKKMAPVGGTPPVGFAAPPPPPPFAGGSAAKTADPQRPGPLIGFFDEESEGAKTEVFNRDMAARYAAMLDDEDEGDHTELFSSHDMDPEVAAILEQEGGTSGVKKAPGRIVAEDKKK